MGRQLGRPRRGQALLTRERILAVALQLVDDHGIDALSMRRVASELDVDPMALYHHLPGKRAVIVGIIELAFGELRVHHHEGMSWQDRVRAFARAYHNLVRAHPQLPLYLVSNLEVGADAVLEASELLYAALADAGLSAPQIVAAADLLVDYLNGLALVEMNQLKQTGEPQGLPKLLDRYAPEQFPVMRRVFRLTEAVPLPGVEVGVDIIVDGIESLLKTDNQF
jgi:TetR/AcrR family transcriptional regulator, tetracycline repressor protein